MTSDTACGQCAGRRDRSTSPTGPPDLVAVDPFVGGLPTDAVASRQLRDVEHVALVISDELHALIHE
jgi:hypothetical protein